MQQIVGLGVACELARQEMPTEAARLLKLREKLRRGIQDEPVQPGHLLEGRFALGRGQPGLRSPVRVPGLFWLVERLQSVVRVGLEAVEDAAVMNQHPVDVDLESA